MALPAMPRLLLVFVLLAAAAQASEVMTLDEPEIVESGGSGDSELQFGHVDPAAVYANDLDSDEASLDNGDDTDLSEMRSDLGEGMDSPSAPGAKPAAPGAKPAAPGAKPAAPGAKPAAPGAKPAAPGAKPKPSAPGAKASAPGAKPSAPGSPAGEEPKKSIDLPKLPVVSKTDEKYMPAIMNKLMTMRKEMAKIKGADWMHILEEHRDGVVQIMVVKKKFMWKAAYRAPLSEEISGSGWFIDNKEFSIDTKDELIVVTNAHVAKNAAEINILVPSLGQEPVPAEVIGLCSQRDIALLKVKNKKKLLALYKAKTGKDSIVKMKLGDSDDMKRGARVMAVGYPLGLKSVKASMGIVSGYQQFKSALYLQITAPINPGNSGGPLFNEQGQVVGINSAKMAKASGMSFSIASVQLKVMLDVLRQRREFVVPYLGYSWSVGTKLIQKYLKVKGDKESAGGIYITKVRPNGLFQQAGVQDGDLLLTIDGANVDRFGQTWMPSMKDNINILGLLARKKIGTQLVLGVWRKSASQMLSLRAKYDQTPPFAVPFVYEPLLHKPKFQILAGVVLMELSVNIIQVMLESNVAELIKMMRPENRMKPAVIVAGVLPGSLASLDGSIKPGLIVQILNGQAVQSIDDVCKILNGDTPKWYTVATHKTFSAFKAKQVEEATKEAVAMVGKTRQYCDPTGSGSGAGSARIPGNSTTAAGSADTRATAARFTSMDLTGMLV